jgi:hypothetical protein
MYVQTGSAVALGDGAVPVPITAMRAVSHHLVAVMPFLVEHRNLVRRTLLKPAVLLRSMEPVVAMKGMFARLGYVVQNMDGVELVTHTVGLLASRSLDIAVEKRILCGFKFMRLRSMMRLRLGGLRMMKVSIIQVQKEHFVTILAEFSWQIPLSLKRSYSHHRFEVYFVRQR